MSGSGEGADFKRELPPVAAIKSCALSFLESYIFDWSLAHCPLTNERCDYRDNMILSDAYITLFNRWSDDPMAIQTSSFGYVLAVYQVDCK